MNGEGGQDWQVVHLCASIQVLHHCGVIAVIVVVEQIGEEEERAGWLEKLMAVGLGKMNWFCPLHGDE